MTKVAVNPIIEGMSGKLGDLVFKQYGEDVVVARAPRKNGRTPTANQLATQERFRQGAQYGKLTLAQPAVRAVYAAAARISGKGLFATMLADYLKAPSVDEVDASKYTGQPAQGITVKAHDDFEVMGVTVTIREAGGAAVEGGAAVQNPPGSGQWVYTTTQTVANVTGVTITATATDRPGNLGTRTVTK